jgi:hypothetical protein
VLLEASEAKIANQESATSATEAGAGAVSGRLAATVARHVTNSESGLTPAAAASRSSMVRVPEAFNRRE